MLLVMQDGGVFYGLYSNRSDWAILADFSKEMKGDDDMEGAAKAREMFVENMRLSNLPFTWVD